VTLEYTPAGDELTVDLPEDGTWYWRVIPVYGFGDTGMTGASRPASFNIERLAALVAPVPQAPADKRTVTTLEIARRGLVFSFHAEGGLRRGNIEIADNASFTGMTRRLEATGGFATLRDPLPPGIWYWRAEGLDSDGSRSPVSSIRSLRIVDLGAAGLKPVTPAHQAELEGESVGFQWDGPDMLGTYRWRMAADEAFQEKLLEENLTGRSLRREKLAPGRWFWQVFLVSEDGQELSTGPVRSFLLRSRLAAPRLLAPTEGMVVDMRRANTLLFSWEEVPGTDRYRLRLLDANGRIIASGMLAKPPWSFTELEKLDVGRFRWEVQAFPAGNNRLPGPVAAAVFTISLGPPPEAPQLLSPEVQYVD
jgi:hypothetical protein